MTSSASNSSSLQTHQQTNRLDFLFEAGHTMLSQCPPLSRYYMNEFQNTLTEYELVAHKTIARLSCKSCGQINVPGLNHKVAIIQKSHKNNSKKAATRTRSKNKIKSTCLTCGNTTLNHGSIKKKMPKLAMQQEPVIKTTSNSDFSPMADVLSKKKKNKGKKNNLKALLSKQQQQKSNNSSGGGLGDFLSSL
ncbi:hypothetical protein [Parasitella parasitica]|uniref:Uncharacterized protein n=1 Tax=Parasitella parasitica TaxID=35722 RepID=A0A0B7NPP8_9FUNG|nr:hypothetical protein [Parasitella parasitica]